jgi:hypothetical protein
LSWKLAYELAHLKLALEIADQRFQKFNVEMGTKHCFDFVP